MDGVRFKVLFLPGPYPGGFESGSGVLTQKIAGAISEYCDLAVLFVAASTLLQDKAYDIEYEEEDRILTVKVSYGEGFLKVPGLGGALRRAIRNLRASYLGFKGINNKFGKPDIVHVFGTSAAGFLALVLKKWKKIPYIITEPLAIDEKHSDRADIKPVHLKFLEKWIFNNAGFFGPQSEYLMAALKKESYEMIGKEIYRTYSSLLTKWEAGLCSEKIEIAPDWKVLDVGSGHRPNRRANVLLDKEIDRSIHRSGEKAKALPGKIFVMGDATNMPFSDREFDYSICSQVAEHIEDVEKLISELERVSQRGYLETPGPVSEIVFNEPYHLWFIRKRKDRLRFEKKKRFKPLSSFFYALFYLNEKRYGKRTFSSQNIFLKAVKLFLNRIWKYIPLTYTKYHWDGKIRYKIIK